MTPSAVLSDRSSITAVLHDDRRFVPHGIDDRSSGATAALRVAMARFSPRATHPARRAAVEQLIDGLDLDRAQHIAARLTSEAVALDLGIDAISRTVPTGALVELLGWNGRAGDVDAIVSDVGEIVAVIGRGRPATDASDAATVRLAAIVADHDQDATAALSILYQNFDATASAVRNAVASRRTGCPAEPAVARTRRVAVVSVVVAGMHLDPGDEVHLEIGAAGLPYGAGPHECPGRLLAERIVAGIAGIVGRVGVVGVVGEPEPPVG